MDEFNASKDYITGAYVSVDGTEVARLESELATANRHLETLRACMTYKHSKISDADIRAAIEAGWLPSERLHPVYEELAYQRVVDTSISISDLDETVAKIRQLEDERDEAVVQADIAGYTRDCIAARCRNLESQLADFEAESEAV
ncbi:hypothetical protein ACFSQT_14210 [Mesorhizobium calcicola]|uniref:Uncharacterized protein n=1 Tax=Mesorhizobium calcicola TaxID=1300310 RepID=A0ABW4WCH5_9HYPH